MIDVAHLVQQTEEETRLHGEALTKAGEGDFVAARHALYCLARLYDSDNPEDMVNAARVRRDLAFVDVRHALNFSETAQATEALEEAHETLDTALALTHTMMERRDLTRRAEMFVLAEHGATIGVAARALSVRGVMRVVREPGKHVADIDDSARALYLSAHRWLLQGSNAYYLGSNAMNAARHDRAMERIGKVPHWLGRAGHAVLRACMSDPANTQPVMATIGHRVDALRSVSRARRSILQKP